MKVEFEKKRFIFPSILLLCAVGIYVSDSFFFKSAVPSLPTSTKLDNTNNQAKPVKMPSQVWVNDGLDKIPSPFSILPTGAVNPGSEPNIVSVSIPKIQNTPPPINISNIHFPNSGDITGKMPGGKPMSIIVKAILQGEDGNNMAVLGNGVNELVVSEGQNSDWGYVSSITDRAVVLNQKTLLLPQ